MPSKGVEMRLVGIYFSRLSTREIKFPTRLISTFPWKVLNNHFFTVSSTETVQKTKLSKTK